MERDFLIFEVNKISKTVLTFQNIPLYLRKTLVYYKNAF